MIRPTLGSGYCSRQACPEQRRRGAKHVLSPVEGTLSSEICFSYPGALAQPGDLGLIRPLAEPWREIIRFLLLRTLRSVRLNFRIRIFYFVALVIFVVKSLIRFGC